jgi:hypothetical protein
VLLQDTEALHPGPEVVTLQRSVDGAGGDVDPSHRERVADALRSPGGLRQGLGQDAPLEHCIECGRPPGAPLPVLGMQPLGPVAFQAAFQRVIERAGHAGLAAGSADVSELGGAPEEPEPLSLYLVLEGHRSPSPVGVSQQQLRRRALMALNSLISEVSTLRHSSH